MTSSSSSQVPLPGVIVIEPTVYEDDRGFFFESFNTRDFNYLTGMEVTFVQDNHSKSSQGVLRGLHYQVQQAQGKLIRVVEGSIFDVAVDIREGSPTFGKWFGIELTAENKKQVWVPPDFAHGFLVFSEVAQVLYKSTDYYAPEHERSIRWDDPELAINWPELPIDPLLSNKDKKAASLRDADLPQFSP